MVKNGTSPFTGTLDFPSKAGIVIFTLPASPSSTVSVIFSYGNPVSLPEFLSVSSSALSPAPSAALSLFSGSADSADRLSPDAVEDTSSEDSARDNPAAASEALFPESLFPHCAAQALIKMRTINKITTVLRQEPFFFPLPFLLPDARLIRISPPGRHAFSSYRCSTRSAISAVLP